MSPEVLEQHDSLNRTIWGTIRAHAETAPERPFLSATDAQTHTYASFANLVTRMAAVLADQGISAGDHVAIVLENGLEWVASWYALSGIGAVTVAVNLMSTPRELEYVLEHAEVTTVIGNSAGADLNAAQRGLDQAMASLDRVTYLDVETLIRRISARPNDEADMLLDDLHAHGGSSVPGLLQYTSGSTSLPKGVLLSQQQLVANGQAFVNRLHLTERDRIWSAMPLYHCAGTVGSVLLAAVAGAELVLARRFDAEQALDEIRKTQPSIVVGLDVMWERILALPRARRHFEQVRAGWITGSGEDLKRISSALGIKGLVNLYGLTEGSPNVTCGDSAEPLDLRIATNGLPHRGVEVQVVDPDTREIRPRGEVGEIRFRGWNRMIEYWKDPQATANAIDDAGWLHTGDLGLIRSDGRLVFTSRRKDMLRVGGENVAASEIEDVISAVNGVVQAQVIGIDDARLGEVPWVFIELAVECSPERAVDKVLQASTRTLARFKSPRAISIVSSWPLTGSGKIQKPKLRDWPYAQLIWSADLADADPRPT